MSGWLGTMNYGVIVANKMDKQLYEWSKMASDYLTLLRLGPQIKNGSGHLIGDFN
jgi:hypothetical protein